MSGLYIDLAVICGLGVLGYRVAIVALAEKVGPPP